MRAGEDCHAEAIDPHRQSASGRPKGRASFLSARQSATDRPMIACRSALASAQSSKYRSTRIALQGAPPTHFQNQLEPRDARFLSRPVLHNLPTLNGILPNLQ